jgi:undecaprenyl-diphosphatase
VTLYAAVWLYQFASSQLDAETPVAVVLALVLALALLGPWLLIRFGGRLRRSVAMWVTVGLRALATSRAVRAFGARFPRMARFIADRLVRSSATGLGLSVTIVLAAAVAWFFSELLFTAITGGSVSGTDRRVLNLAATFRTPSLDQIMLAVTLLGNAEVIAVITASAIVLLSLLGWRREAALVLVAVLSSEFFVLVLNLLVGRPRPPLEDARLIQGGFSFSSGHSAVSATLYGTLAYLLTRAVHSPRRRAVIGSVAALLVVAIGLSRIYLGVQYPSDVLAGWALGALWVLVVVMLEDIWERNSAPSLPPRRRRVIGVLLTALLVVASLALATVYRQAPALAMPTGPALQVIPVAAVPLTIEMEVQHHTEDLFGHQQEPLNLIFVATPTQLEGTFRAAGWVKVKRFGLLSVVQAIGATLTQQPFPNGPGTPSFWNDEPETIAFSLPVGTTFAQRHHIRLWQTRYMTTDGRMLCVATASYDRGFELAPSNFLPTHAIAPDIDTERAFIAARLAQTGHVTMLDSIQLMPPEHGYNFAGDPYYTDGQAVILLLG